MEGLLGTTRLALIHSIKGGKGWALLFANWTRIALVMSLPFGDVGEVGCS